MNHSTAQQGVWRRLIHTDPSALDDEPNRWSSIWGPGQALLHELGALPDGLLSFWVHTNRGHVLIGNRPSAVLPGPQQWRSLTFNCLCLLRSADIAPKSMRLWRALFTLFDYVLGGNAEGMRLSSGYGATPRLREVAERLQRATALGYAHELIEAEQGDRATYLVETWRLYLNAPNRLNTADPLTYRLFADSLMNETFWQLVLRELD